MNPIIILKTTTGEAAIFTAHITYMIKKGDEETEIHINTGDEHTILIAKYKTQEIIDMIIKKT